MLKFEQENRDTHEGCDCFEHETNHKTLSRLSCGSRFVISVPQSYYSIEKNTRRDCFTTFAMTPPSQRIRHCEERSDAAISPWGLSRRTKIK